VRDLLAKGAESTAIEGMESLLPALLEDRGALPPTVVVAAVGAADVLPEQHQSRFDGRHATDVRTPRRLAGSVTTVTAQAWSLPFCDADRIHLSVTLARRMRAAARELLETTRAQRAALPFMHPGRVDVIGAGALICDLVIAAVQERSGRGDALTVVASEHDILDGIALGLGDGVAADG
jgi:exopolyphosphatase/guanosine-5'-triphosphate,3'-diphosphate pyrophosphatase